MAQTPSPLAFHNQRNEKDIQRDDRMEANDNSPGHAAGRKYDPGRLAQRGLQKDGFRARAGAAPLKPARFGWSLTSRVGIPRPRGRGPIEAGKPKPGQWSSV